MFKFDLTEMVRLDQLRADLGFLFPAVGLLATASTAISFMFLPNGFPPVVIGFQRQRAGYSQPLPMGIYPRVYERPMDNLPLTERSDNVVRVIPARLAGGQLDREAAPIIRSVRL